MNIEDLKQSSHYVEKILPESENIFVITHGGSKGIDSTLIQKIFESITNNKSSAVMFDFTYLINGVKNSEGLVNEFDDLDRVYLDIRHRFPDKKLHLVGKSLGGVVCSWLASKNNTDVSSISILGYLIGDVRLTDFSNPIIVIQGEHDKYGTPENVQQELSHQKSRYFLKIIPSADHSYKDVTNEEIKYEDQAVNMLVLSLNEASLL